jgi:C4-dicarboxylate transporter, DctQ subunit
MRPHTLLDRAEEAFLALSLAFMTIVTFVQVVLRYAFGSGFVWHLEATTYTFAWLVLIGMSYGVRTNAHIAVDLMTSRLGPRAARAAGLAALVLGLVYSALMIYGSAVFVDRLLTLGNMARDIPLPRWLLVGIMPVAFVLLALRLLQAAWRPLVLGRGPARPPGAAGQTTGGPVRGAGRRDAAE